MKLLYVCDDDSGGIAEYAILQFHALMDAGAEVTFLCRPTFPVARLKRGNILAGLPHTRARHPFMPARALREIVKARTLAQRATNEALIGNYDAVLFACYREYFAPFWAAVLRRAASRGLRIGTIAHDPVRDYQVGPLWWHRWSIRQGYSFIGDVFLHDNTAIDFGGNKPRRIRVHVIPCGPFEFVSATRDRQRSRDHYGFCDEDAVFLSFGQIRDGKNLDRFMLSMKRLPARVKLLVAGSGGSNSQRPPAFYVQLADKLGVAHRCTWDLRYIPDAETGDVFSAADHLLMTYSAQFRSASGVMNIAVHACKTILASSGPGPFQTAVKEYNLGVFVKPDDDDAIVQGALALLSSSRAPEWERYKAENSWAQNARGILEAFAQ